MGIEFELKFRANRDILDQIRETVPGAEQVFEMETTYYDTESGSLSARHYTLRRRQENALSVCTLKTPTGGLGRQEYEVNCPTIEQAIPQLSRLSGALLPEAVVPVCGARFTRIAKTVKLADCTVEIALDQGVLTGGGKEIPLCEVEVERKEGTEAAVRAYGLQLALAFGLEPEEKSKFRRAKDLAEG